MGLWNTIRIALVALRLNKMRSFLTMLGIIIGISSVIVMVSVSSGSKAEIERAIDRLGSNMLSIRPGSSMFGRRGGAGSADPLTEKHVQALKNQFDFISAISGQISDTVAVLLMKLDNVTVRRARTANTSRSLPTPVRKESCRANRSASPVSTTAAPSDRPPATSISVSQGRPRTWAAPITCVIVKPTMGIREIAATWIPCNGVVSHSSTVNRTHRPIRESSPKPPSSRNSPSVWRVQVSLSSLPRAMP